MVLLAVLLPAAQGADPLPAGAELGPWAPSGDDVVMVRTDSAPEIDGVVMVPEALPVGGFHSVTVTGALGPDLEAA